MIKLPDNVMNLLHLIEQNGYHPFVVGGAVRDLVMGNKPKDWDITSDATPEEIMDVFAGYNVVATGLKYGTVTVFFEDGEFEITTFRQEEEYKDGRHPDNVTYINELPVGEQLYIDSCRRDFTMNAMYINSRLELFDFHNGLQDIRNKIIQVVGDCYDRFSEDNLRILRAIRFVSTLNFSLSYKISNYLCSNFDFDVSAERIQKEFNNLICGKNVSRAFGILLRHNLLKDVNYLLKDVNSNLKDYYTCTQNNPHHVGMYLQYNTVFQHTMDAIRFAPDDVIIRLALIFHDIGKYNTKTTDSDNIDHFLNHAKESEKITRDILTKLKYSNSEIHKVCTLIKYHTYQFATAKKSTIKKLINKIGIELTYKLLILRKCDILGQTSSMALPRLDGIYKAELLVDEIINSQEPFSLKDIKINGYDLIKIGFKGKDIGEALQFLLDYVIEYPSKNNFNDLKVEAEQLYLFVNGE